MEPGHNQCLGVGEEYLELVLLRWNTSNSFIYQFHATDFILSSLSAEMNKDGIANVIDAAETALQNIARGRSSLALGIDAINEAAAKERRWRYSTASLFDFIYHFHGQLSLLARAGCRFNPYGLIANLVINEAHERKMAAQDVQIHEICLLLNRITNDRLLGPNPFDPANLELTFNLDVFIEEYPASSRKGRARNIRFISSQLQEAGYACHAHLDELFPDAVPIWKRGVAKKAIRKLKSTGSLFRRFQQHQPKPPPLPPLPQPPHVPSPMTPSLAPSSPSFDSLPSAIGQDDQGSVDEPNWDAVSYHSLIGSGWSE